MQKNMDSLEGKRKPAPYRKAENPLTTGFLRSKILEDYETRRKKRNDGKKAFADWAILRMPFCTL